MLKIPDAKDFPGTIKLLADTGFQRIELCSPAGYAESGFGDIGKYKGAELRKILAAEPKMADGVRAKAGT